MKFASLYFELIGHNKQEFFPIQKVNTVVLSIAVIYTSSG